jgi:hypothetical protein
MRFPALAAALFLFSSPFALHQADEFLRIDSPAADETVSGSVEVRGSAAVPGMTRYRVEFANDPNPAETWFLIAEGTEPVTDGLLAVWDTSPVTPGEYALRISAVFADDSMREAAVLGIRVRRGPSSTPLPPVEGITPMAPDPQTHAGPAAAFPASTAVFPAEPSTRSTANSSLGMAFLIGAVSAATGFGLYWLRSRWLRWKRRKLIRKIRKGWNQ